MQPFEDLKPAERETDLKYNGKWFVHAKAVGTWWSVRALTTDNPPEVHEPDVDNAERYYFDTEAEVYRAMHAYYEFHNKGHEFPYHNEFMSAHHMKGVLDTGVKSQTMVFE